MISIVIPVYNVEKYLLQCLDSILVQTYTDFELVLVDDGSSDKSGAICDDYASKDSRVRVIHQENAGVSVARNRGMMAANAEWICFIDSDDFVEPDFLAAFKLDDDDVDLIVQGLEYYNQKTGEYFSEKRLKNIRLTKDNLKAETASCELLHLGFPVGKAFRNKLLKDRGLLFDSNLSFHEDHIFVLEALLAARSIRLSQSVAYKYRFYHSVDTLSNKRYPWQELNTSAENMLVCINKMKDRFLQEDSEYCRKIYHFAYSPKIRAVYQLYRENYNRKEREKYFMLIIEKKQLKKYFHPNDKKNKVIKEVLNIFPFFLIDAFLHFAIIYQSRNIRAML